MLIKFIEAGQIVATHGIKGEVRVNPWCDSPKFLTTFKTFYFDKNGNNPVKVISSRVANNVVLMKFSDVNSIEEAQSLKNRILYIDRNDADIGDSYFVSELIGCKIYDVDTNKLLGEVSDVSTLPANDVWHIKNGEKEYLIPAIPDVIVNVDVEKEIGYIRPLKGIFDDED